VPLGFTFILYKHGPFSFDLRDELTAERADGLLKLDVQPGYGPRFEATPQGDLISGKFSVTLRRYTPQIDFIAHHVGKKRD
jgi:hypothetical protein